MAREADAGEIVSPHRALLTWSQLWKQGLQVCQVVPTALRPVCPTRYSTMHC